MKKLIPFSKEMIHDTTVSNDDGQRSGFTEKYTITQCGKPESIPHMVGGMPWKDMGEDEHTKGDQYPDFKSRDDDGLPSFPAPFSKKNISGGPAHPGTPA